jgi:hypothetical protein
MGDYEPAYSFNFALNIVVVIILFWSMLRGYKWSFAMKNNFSTFLLIPITLVLPYAIYYIPEEFEKFTVFLIILTVMGFLNAFS